MAFIALLRTIAWEKYCNAHNKEQNATYHPNNWIHHLISTPNAVYWSHDHGILSNVRYYRRETSSLKNILSVATIKARIVSRDKIRVMVWWTGEVALHGMGIHILVSLHTSARFTQNSYLCSCNFILLWIAFKIQLHKTTYYSKFNIVCAPFSISFVKWLFLL